MTYGKLLDDVSSRLEDYIADHDETQWRGPDDYDDPRSISEAFPRGFAETLVRRIAAPLADDAGPWALLTPLDDDGDPCEETLAEVELGDWIAEAYIPQATWDDVAESLYEFYRED